MRGPVFEHARTPECFAEARVDSESGTVTWPGDADLAPDTLYQRVRTGAWPEQDGAALSALGMTSTTSSKRDSGCGERDRTAGDWRAIVRVFRRSAAERLVYGASKHVCRWNS